MLILIFFFRIHINVQSKCSQKESTGYDDHPPCEIDRVQPLPGRQRLEQRRAYFVDLVWTDLNGRIACQTRRHAFLGAVSEVQRREWVRMHQAAEEKQNRTSSRLGYDKE